MNLFEIATRKAYRFPSLKGELTVEQVWELPLTSRNGWDLDTVARGINTELKALGEESFVSKGANPKRAVLQNKLDILKYVIEVKQNEATDAEKRVANQQEIRKIEELLAQKSNEALAGLSKEDLEAKLAALKA